MRLLIAEDDSVTRLNLSAAGQRFGHEVTAEADGRAAWEAFQRGGYSVVISDWDMPEMDGTELCRRIRAWPSDQYVYFILVATRGGRQRYLEGMEAGADDFITKPVDLEELKARLKVAERILDLRHHLHRLEGLLPICSYCRRIDDPGKGWRPLEQLSRVAPRPSSATGFVRSATSGTSGRNSTHSNGFDLDPPCVRAIFSRAGLRLFASSRWL